MKYLFLSPHTDDAELGCGATIARLIEEGHEVFILAFSFCGKDELVEEYRRSSNALGLKKENILLENFQVRTFNESRQLILDTILKYKDIINPDVVFMPSPNDFHQDHKVIHDEGLRAFKHSSIMSYELPWNNLSFNTIAFTVIHIGHLNKKIEALRCYDSQSHRNYMNADFITSLARVRGVQAGCNYAEAFEVIRLVNLI